MYRVFVRNWWRIERGIKVPDPTARKTTLTHTDTEVQAQKICKAYNDKHDPGPLSRKAEYERT